MSIEHTHIEDLVVIESAVFTDDRGLFFEPYNREKLKEKGITSDFVQDNLSLSKKNVFRGMHLQFPPFAQAKFVRVLRGRAIDFVIDIRRNSPTFLQFFEIELSEENKLAVFVPEGCLHGFLSLEDDTLFSYKVNHLYNKESESGVVWTEAHKELYERLKDIPMIVSDKDKILPDFTTFMSTNPY